MMMRSGSGSSLSEETQAGSLCFKREILEWHILDEPLIQGSRRIWKGFGL